MLDGLLAAAGEKNIKIGDDISVVSFGRMERSPYIAQKITYMNQSGAEMGREAGIIMRDMLEGKQGNRKTRGKTRS